MKNKPVRHKESNTFRFKSFGDRIAEVDIRRSALYHIDHINTDEIEGDIETNFRKAYLKWTTLNLTDEYRVFEKKIRNIVTLPQLIHRKDEVVELLLEHLSTATNLSLQPLLEFIVVLARDLREDFYIHFQVILEKLIKLLNTKDADQLEWTLICLAYLFKTLKRFLKEDVSVVLDAILPLLDDRNPAHLTNFAAECFSFVARDIKDKKKFIRIVLKNLKKHDNGVNGCGRLLYEIVRGVNNQFHICTEEFLTVLLSNYEDETIDGDLLFELTKEMVQHIMGGIAPKNFNIYWKVLIKVIMSFVQQNSKKKELILFKLFHLMGHAVEYRSGKYITEVKPIVECILTNIDKSESLELSKVLAQIVVLLLMSENMNLTQLDASTLSMKVLQTDSKEIFETLVLNLVNYSQFEILILPSFRKYLEANFSNELLMMLSKVILTKQPLCKNGVQLASWKKYPIHFRKPEIINSISDIVCSFNPSETTKSQEVFLAALSVYPHITNGKISEEVESFIIQYITDICEELKSIRTQDTIDKSERLKLYQILNMLIEMAYHCEINSIDFGHISDTIISNCSAFYYMPALNTLDMMITIAKETGNSDLLNKERFLEFHAALSNNLMSSHHEIRLITAHCFNQYANIKDSPINKDYNIYEMIYSVEQIEPHVQTYRDQLVILQKFAADGELYQHIKSSVIKDDPLKYLLGTLFINFKLLWGPISKIIVSYGEHINGGDFWKIFYEKMHYATKHIRDSEHYGIRINKMMNPSEYEVLFEKSLIDISYKVINNRADYLNYRILLWRILVDLPTVCETKNRDIVSDFSDFIEMEYKHKSEDRTDTWNLIRNSTTKEDSFLENIDEDSLTNAAAAPKGVQRTLISMLNVFSKMTNPKALYKESFLFETYLHLLTTRNNEIVKIALDCIAKYKFDYIETYKTQLYNILDDKLFRDTLVSFTVNKEKGAINETHRPKLMPILLRMLYSRMMTRSGSQKGSSQLRKSLVMRFLGGCSEKEILMFMGMVFSSFNEYLERDLRDIDMLVHTNIHLDSIPSPKRLSMALNLVEVIRDEFGGLMGGTFLQYLLKVIVCVGAIAGVVFESAEMVSAGHLTLFKNLRNACISSITNFFEQFDKYPWTDDETDAVFDVFVWNLLPKLPADSIHNPTPLLKLFSVWSKNARYFVLLSKYKITDESLTPLPYIFKLYLNDKSKPLVCKAIAEIIDNLFKLGDELPDDVEQINVKCSVKQTPVEFQNESNTNYGSFLLLPYIPQVLNRLQINLGNRKTLTKLDLSILSRATELVSDSETCDILLKILVPILVRKAQINAGEEVLMQMVITLSNLLGRIDTPEVHIKNIAPMFEQMQAIGPRKKLCVLLHDIAKTSAANSPQLLITAEIVTELNAMDRRWIDQPDHERRLLAFKRVSSLIEKEQIDMDLGLLVIYHAFSFIKYDKDMAVRDTSSHFLKAVSVALIKKYIDEREILDHLIGNVLLNIIRKTLSSKNDNVRYEGIQLLGELARECSQSHPVLRDLNYVTNKQDREVDFFDNLTHLQSHRHGRGLLKFCAIAKTLEKAPNPRTLTQFILPFATQYLCTEKYITKHALIDNAIETVGVVCRLLPWHQYDGLLKYYLKKLRFNIEYRKQLVRIVIAILDAFHFDLSKGRVKKEELEEEFKKVINESEKETETEEMETEENTTNGNTEEDTGENGVNMNGVDDDDDELESALSENSKSDTEEDEEIDEEIEAPSAKKMRVCAFEQETILSEAAAKRVIHKIATGLIPNLNKSIVDMANYERKHKVNKKKRGNEREEEETLRVPIALAMVKLLKKLPDGMLDYSLPGVFMKVCQYLRSPLKSVRMIARDILRKIMLELGSDYLGILLDQMRTMLTKGFQVHVLTVTVHNILEALRTSFKPGDIDKNLDYILYVILEDIFGKQAEEKEVDKIGVHAPEAKTSEKSFLTLQILATNISENCMLDLLVPLKDQLIKSQSRKLVAKVQQCFQKIVIGLMANKQLSTESLLIFIYGTTSESIPELMMGKDKPVLTEAQREKLRRQVPDSFIIQPEPRSRTGVIRKVVRTNVSANAHVLIEFGLDLLHIVLKRGRILKIEYEQFLNPLILIMESSLHSNEIRVTTYALKCFASLWSLKLQVAEMENVIENVMNRIFQILHKYAAAGITKSNENYHLVKNGFKAIVSCLQHVKYFAINEEQLKALLIYAEQDFYDSDRQSTSFALMRAILNRKLQTTELHQVIEKIIEISIVSESNSARNEARTIALIYLLEYPLGKKVDYIIRLFIRNLTYETIAGRESAIKMLHAVIKRFPKKEVTNRTEFLFLSLGPQLVNDDSPECRMIVAECLETLLNKVDVQKRNDLCKILLDLFNDEKSSHKEMAALLTSRILAVEAQEFNPRIKILLPELLGCLSIVNPKAPGRFVKLNSSNFDSLDLDFMDDPIERAKREQIIRSKDHQIIQAQYTILKILKEFPDIINEDEYKNEMDTLGYESQRLLAHEHSWIRFNAAQILEVILTNMDFELIRTLLVEDVDENSNLPRQYIYSNPETEIKSLVLDLCAQLQPEVTEEDMAEQVVTNLLFLANMLTEIPIPKSMEDVENMKLMNKIHLGWLIRRIRYVVHAEVAQAPLKIILRTAIFNWIRGFVQLIDKNILEQMAPQLLSPLVREMSEDDQNIDAKVRSQAKSVGNTIKELLGEEQYNLLLTQLQKKLFIKRAERRKLLAQERINDPERAAKRKQSEKDKKKLAKKRKMDVLKGKAAPKKRKLKRTVEEDD